MDPMEEGVHRPSLEEQAQEFKGPHLEVAFIKPLPACLGVVFLDFQVELQLKGQECLGLHLIMEGECQWEHRIMSHQDIKNNLLINN
jgi:hypothetical protein